MKAMLCVVGAMMLAGCGTANNHDTAIRDAVANRVFLYQAPGAGDATLLVVRENGWFGGGCSSQIHIDDKYAAQLEIGEQVAFHLPSGTHAVTLDNSGACRKPGDARVDATVGAGESVTIDINAHGSSLSLAKR
ncbi:hypothetical protein ACXU4B_09915 [Dyella soli]|uniref:DUF2846 domain-containing protein n=1 Tax=Dyella soli TaxID=522319 RepID=A0A4R0Z038_9GAMM|nr:hypothetical protein [Dyella soli]TCI11244.1 hypothetical protein EZM97_20805 [Dyella soli]